MTMHPKAEAALREKFSKLVASIRIGSNNTWALDWEHLNPLTAQLAKEKSEYLSPLDAVDLVYDVIYPNEPETTDPSAKAVTPTIHDKLVNDFIKAIHHIPTKIDYSFPLPRITLKLFNDLAINDTERFEFRPYKNSDNSVTEILFFTTTVKGYWSYDFDSPTPREALSRLKAAMQFLQGDDIFYSTKYHWSDFVFEGPPSLLNAAINYQTPFKQSTLDIELPRSISDFLSGLFLSPSRLAQKRTTTTNIQNDLEHSIARMARLLQSDHPHSDKIRAAAEWQIDAQSTHNETMALIQLCIGLESIYGDDSPNGGLTETLSDRCAYSLATSHHERTRIKKEFKEIYKLRSKIVHGVINNLKPEDRIHSRNALKLLRDSIKRESGLL
ncbi:hypothetical protein [Pseudomonas solani]|uniref:hypothetical protein n=1 Tax=Pseudomonas solani TaxID=2731552 RepID=UPI003D6AC709